MELTVVFRRGDREEICLTLQGASRLTGIPPLWIRRMVRLGLISPVSERPLFTPEALARIVKIERLRNQLDLSLSAMGVVMGLLDRVEALEEEVERLRLERFCAEPPERP
jgi:DNA-binding transcriptional MerR regulator